VAPRPTRTATTTGSSPHYLCCPPRPRLHPRPRPCLRRPRGAGAASALATIVLGRRDKSRVCLDSAWARGQEMAGWYYLNVGV
jgi:hypothetical protein